jgi:hypothetical protein
MLLLGEKIFLSYLFIAIIANPAPLNKVIGAYFKTNPCFLLVRAAGPCFSLIGGICKFDAGIFDH